MHIPEEGKSEESYLTSALLSTPMKNDSQGPTTHEWVFIGNTIVIKNETLPCMP